MDNVRESGLDMLDVEFVPIRTLEDLGGISGSHPSDHAPLRGHGAARFDPGREPLTVLSLFAGTGGFDLGLERTGGFKTIAFCEIDPFCQKVLAKHWPGVPIYYDVRTLTAEQVGPVDVICGGFPCQDISFAGRGAGLAGERSGLWSEYARLIGELRPSFVIVENVAALLGRGLATVLGDLAALGYDAQWDCIPASAVGAPHRRDRLWIIAYPRSEQHEGCSASLGRQITAQLSSAHPNAAGERFPEARQFRCDQPEERLAGVGQEVSHPESIGRGQGNEDSGRGGQRGGPEQGAGPWSSDWWSVEPDVGRVAHGVPKRVDRLRSLGNAVVPQIPELLGRAILAKADERPAGLRLACEAQGVARQRGAAEERHSPEGEG